MLWQNNLCYVTLVWIKNYRFSRKQQRQEKKKRVQLPRIIDQLCALLISVHVGISISTLQSHCPPCYQNINFWILQLNRSLVTITVGEWQGFIQLSIFNNENCQGTTLIFLNCNYSEDQMVEISLRWVAYQFLFTVKKKYRKIVA